MIETSEQLAPSLQFGMAQIIHTLTFHLPACSICPLVACCTGVLYDNCAIILVGSYGTVVSTVFARSLADQLEDLVSWRSDCLWLARVAR